MKTISHLLVSLVMTFAWSSSLSTPARGAERSLEAEAHRAICTEIAEVAEPTAVIVQNGLSDGAAAITSLFQINSGLHDLAVRYPGMEEFVIEMLHAQEERYFTTSLAPRMHEMIASYYADHLAPKEARIFLTFLRTPAMQAVVNRPRRYNENPTALGMDLRSIPEKDQRELARFFHSPLGRKIQTLMKDKVLIDAKLANEITPDRRLAITRTVQRAIVAHIGKTDKVEAARLGAVYARQSQPN
ncbi:hypothetical protein WBP06_00550 [Novosphingobium sp. BL-8H]|uniref:hypothetical protein n=1 Tax=Novosphingobium sp. BL-8H TaxID=3127640 RepID=UPI00375636C8